MDGQVLIRGSTVSQADITYLSSWKQCVSRIVTLLPTGTEGDGGQSIHSMMINLLTFFPDLERDDRPKSFHLIHKLQIEMTDQLVSLVSPTDRVRLHAVRARWAHRWITSTPSLTEDSFLSNITFSDSVSLRLGMTMDGGYPFCHEVSDARGHHALSYMWVGIHIKQHIIFRDCIYRLAQEAGLRPQLEVPGLLPEAPQRRPADIFLPSTTLLWQTAWRRYPSLALDCAILSPFTISAPAKAAEDPAATARTYAEFKRSSQDTMR